MASGMRSSEEVVVRYTLYCHEMGVRTNWVEKDFAFLNWSGDIYHTRRLSSAGAHRGGLILCLNGPR